MTGPEPEEDTWLPPLDQSLVEESLRRLQAAIDAGLDPRTPPETLARLAESWEREIRAAVAANPNTPPGALVALARESEGWDSNNCYWVREMAGENPSTPPEVLVELASDERDFARFAVANPRMPADALAALAQARIDSDHLTDSDCDFLQAIASNPATTPEIAEAIRALREANLGAA
jgi:hypothetical protein